MLPSERVCIIVKMNKPRIQLAHDYHTQFLLIYITNRKYETYITVRSVQCEFESPPGNGEKSSRERKLIYRI